MSSRVKKRTAAQQAAYDQWLAHRKHQMEANKNALVVSNVARPEDHQGRAARPAAGDNRLPQGALMERLERAERALREIEGCACDAIYQTGILKEPPPDRWVKISDMMLNYMAPIRDRARAATKV